MGKTKIEIIEDKLLEELELCDDWRERYDFIIQAGKELTPLSDKLKSDDKKISGCVSQLWLIPKFENGKIHFSADSDSHFVRGLVMLITKIYSNSTPEEILSAKHRFLEESGIIRNLSPNRANGAAQLLKKIIEYALIYSSSGNTKSS